MSKIKGFRFRLYVMIRNAAQAAENTNRVYVNYTNICTHTNTHTNINTIRERREREREGGRERGRERESGCVRERETGKRPRSRPAAAGARAAVALLSVRGNRLCMHA